ncbi:MAG TPA: energy transducer TonB [Gammaproteobacteria bacterium]|nr:energy transducer TonB [Gammaproteobacteria bacterium]
MSVKNLSNSPGGDPSAEDGKGSLASGPLASLETTLPPTPLRDLLAADGASVYIYSSDEALSRIAEEAAGEHFPISIVRAWPELLRSVEGKCRIVLLDVDSVPGGLERGLGELEKAAVSPIILVAATREQSQRLIGLLSERKIHRLLIKPAAVGITRLLLESAVSRYIQLREAPVDPMAELDRGKRTDARAGKSAWPAWVAATAVVSLALGALLVTQLDPFGGPSSKAARVESAQPASAPDRAAPADQPNAASAATATGPEIAAGAAGPAGSPSAGNDAAAGPALAGAPGAPDASAANVPSAIGPNAPPGASTGAAGSPGPAGAAGAAGAARAAGAAGPFADLLTRAQLAEDQGRVADPAGDSALDYYASILKQDPAEPTASARFGALLEKLFSQAEADLLSGSLDDAAAVLADVRRVQPSSGRLSFLDVQLAKARESASGRARTAGAPAGNPPAGTQAAESAATAGGDEGAAEATELARVLSLGRSRLEAGRLLEPKGDSASAYVDRATTLAASDPGVQKLKSDLAASLMVAARVALGAEDFDRAGTLADAAGKLGANAPALAALEADVAAGRQRRDAAQQAVLLANADARLASGRIVAPSSDSALHYLAELAARNATLPGLADRWTRARTAVADKVRAAIAASDWNTAETWTAALEATDPEPTTAGDLRDALTFARRQQEYLRTPAAPGEVRLVESPPLEYPQGAQQRGLEGWVEVRFVIGRDGRPRDLQVVNAQPRNTFDNAALAAVTGQRYEPFVRDGHTYERLAQVRITFQLK